MPAFSVMPVINSCMVNIFSLYHKYGKFSNNLQMNWYNKLLLKAYLPSKGGFLACNNLKTVY